MDNGSADWEESLENEDMKYQKNEGEELEASDESPEAPITKRAGSNVWQSYLDQIKLMSSVEEKRMKVPFSLSYRYQNSLLIHATSEDQKAGLFVTESSEENSAAQMKKDAKKLLNKLADTTLGALVDQTRLKLQHDKAQDDSTSFAKVDNSFLCYIR